jgi:hypothetical protein
LFGNLSPSPRVERGIKRVRLINNQRITVRTDAGVKG